jgi:tetratricopeptide (TPR) repeat protein
MENSMAGSIEKIVQGLKKTKSNGRGCILLTGAGCSVSAGIPDASHWVERIKDRFGKTYSNTEVKDYHHLVQALTQEERTQNFSETLDSAKINWTHIAIAQLMKENFIDRVLTTNFDSLAEKACALLGQFPAVYDGASANFQENDYLGKGSITHLHGQYPGAVDLCTEEGLKALGQSLLPSFREDDFKDFLWIVVGYGGCEKDPVFELLKKADRFQQGLYWINLEDAPPSDHVERDLLSKNKGAVSVQGYDADSFFVTLTRDLGIFPPEFVSQPFSHLHRQIQSIAPFPIPGQSRNDTIDITGTINSEVENSRSQFEGPANSGAKAGTTASKEHREEIRSILSAQGYLLAGQPDRVLSFLKQYEQKKSPVLAELLYWASVIKGDDLLLEFSAEENKEGASSLLGQAAKKYETACEIYSDNARAFFQWGSVLMTQAKQASGAQSEKLFFQAGEKFLKVVEIDPESYSAWHSLGVTCFERGLLDDDKTAEPMFQKARQYFESALAIKEDLPESLFGLGNSMERQAGWVKGGSAVHLFAQAMEKFKLGLKFQPDHFEALASWGHILMKMAENMEHEEGDALLAEAQEKFASAINIKPDFYSAHASLGKVFWMRGARWNIDNAENFFSQAIEKFSSALALNSEMPEALYGWGRVLFTLGMNNKGEKASRFMEQAVEKYKMVLAIEPKNCDALYSWGNALSVLAKSTDPQEAEIIYSQASTKYQEVLTLEPEHTQALTRWGNVYLHLSRIKKGKETIFLDHAAEKYKAALAIEPQNAEALSQWGTILFQMAQRKDYPDTARLLKMAEEKFQASLKIKPANAETYNSLGWILAQNAIKGDDKDRDALIGRAGENFQTAIELNPDMSPAYINWGLALMEQAKTKKGIHVHPFLANAKKKLQKGEDLAPGSGSYPLARLLALLANESGCKEWLEKSKTLGALPHHDIWMHEPDFDNVRESKWFKTLILDQMTKVANPQKKTADLTSKE